CRGRGRHDELREGGRDSRRRAALGRGDSLAFRVASVTSIASSYVQDRERRRLLRMLGAGAIGAALPVRLGAADPSSVTADYCTTPPRFDQRLHVAAGGGLLGYLPLTSEPIVLDAITRTSAPGIAIAARAGRRDYVDPTL